MNDEHQVRRLWSQNYDPGDLQGGGLVPSTRFWFSLPSLLGKATAAGRHLDKYWLVPRGGGGVDIDLR